MCSGGSLDDLFSLLFTLLLCYNFLIRDTTSTLDCFVTNDLWNFGLMIGTKPTDEKGPQLVIL